MKIGQVIVFLLIALGIYGAINYYIFIRGLQALPELRHIKLIYSLVFILLAASFIIGRIVERVSVCPLSNFFTYLGAYWLGAMFYFFLIVLLFDFIRLLQLAVGFYPPFIRDNYSAVKSGLALLSILSVAILLTAGHFNARRPRIKTLNLSVAKTVPGRQTLTIAMASDIHLGTIVGPKRADVLVEKINGLNPDLILFAGDIVDEDLKPVICNDVGNSLLKLHALLGIYTINGNHEYIGGYAKADAYLEAHGIKVLVDSVVNIQEQFYVIGRADRDAFRFTGYRRKTMPELTAGLNPDLPCILLDHQPFALEETAANGIDLQLSGHTHHGQIWPASLITKAMYELSWGYLRKAATHIYVSSGFGTWGPPIRIGNQPEIVAIRLSFQ